MMSINAIFYGVTNWQCASSLTESPFSDIETENCNYRLFHWAKQCDDDVILQSNRSRDQINVNNMLFFHWWNISMANAICSATQKCFLFHKFTEVVSNWNWPWVVSLSVFFIFIYFNNNELKIDIEKSMFYAKRTPIANWRWREIIFKTKWLNENLAESDWTWWKERKGKKCFK